MSEAASLILAIATLISAVSGFIVSLHNSKKIDAVRHLTNGMKTELVDEVRRSSFAKGVKAEKDKEIDDGPPT